MITTRQRILLSLLILGGKSTYQKVLSFLPPNFKPSNYYGILRRMEEDGLVNRRVSGIQSSRSFLRLLSEGLSLLERKYGPRVRRITASGTFDTFYLIIYDFSSDQSYPRSRLQQRLAELGCGCLRRGVYLSPDDILSQVAEWSEDNRVTDRVLLQKIAAANSPERTLSEARRLVSKAWDLSILQKEYLSLLDRLAITKGIPLIEKQTASLRRIRSDYLELLLRDPLLPKSLLSADWPFDRVKERIVTAY